MAQRRDKLEKRAEKLSVEFTAETTDEELQIAVDQAQVDLDEEKRQEAEQEDSTDTQYFRSDIAGLEIVIGDPDPAKGEVAPKTVSFVPYWQQKKGIEGSFKVGYLKTDVGDALRKLADDPNVEEISKDEFYDQTTNEEYAADGSPVSGVRAAL